MEMTADKPKVPQNLSPYDHYVIDSPEEAGLGAKTIGELRAQGCPECGRELTAMSSCSKDLVDYVRLKCMEHGLQPIFSLSKGKAYLVSEEENPS